MNPNQHRDGSSQAKRSKKKKKLVLNLDVAKLFIYRKIGLSRKDLVQNMDEQFKTVQNKDSKNRTFGNIQDDFSPTQSRNTPKLGRDANNRNTDLVPKSLLDDSSHSKSQILIKNYETEKPIKVKFSSPKVENKTLRRRAKNSIKDFKKSSKVLKL